MFLFRKLRFLFLFFIAVVKKRYLPIIFGIFLGSVVFLLHDQISAIVFQKKDSLKIGMVGQFSASEIPDEVLKEISFGLTSVSEKGEVLPNIAKSWSVSDDGKTYTFKLSDSPLFWHDGTKFSPTDINYNFKDIVFKPNDKEMVFQLKEPFSPFPNILSKPLFKKGLLGLGKYRVKKIEKKGKNVSGLFLVGTDKTVTPYQKIYRFYKNEADLKTAFNLGEVNLAKDLFDQDGIYLSPSVGTGTGTGTEIKEKLRNDIYLAVFFNTAKLPYSEKSFRQALAYAIPKETNPLRAVGPLNPNSWAYNPDIKPYSLNLSNANSLLEKEKIDKTTLTIKISTLPQYERLANQIKESWGGLGLKSEINILSFIPDDFDVLIIARVIPPDPDQYSFWHSTQAGNISGFKNLRIDKLLEDGRKTLSKEERKSIYFDFQRFLVEESPAIFLTHPKFIDVTRN